MDRLPIDILEKLSLSSASVRTHHSLAPNNVIIAAWRRRTLIAGMLVLSLIGAGAALLVLKRHYVAEAIVQLDLEKREGGVSADRGPPIALEASSILQGELKIIRSRMVARRVVGRLHLADDNSRDEGLASHIAAITRGLIAQADPAWMRLTGDAFGSLPFSGKSEDGVDRLVASSQRAEDEVMEHTVADTDRRSYVISIKFTSDRPERAAQVANALAEEYIQRRLEANFDAAGKTVEWLNIQVGNVTQQIRSAETTPDVYRAQAGLLELSTAETLGQQQLRDLSGQLSAAVTARNEAQARLARVEGAGQATSVSSVEELKELPQIRTLLERRAVARRELGAVLATVGSRHPLAMQAQATLNVLEAEIATELRRAVSILRSDLATAQQTEREISQRQDVLQRTLISGKAAEAELRNRQATIQNLREQLVTLTRSRDQAVAVQQLQTVAVTLIVPAEPPRLAVSPKPIVVIALALAAGLGLGIVLASVLERRDRGFQTSAEVKPVLGTRCLGIVPDVSRALRPTGGQRGAFEASLLSEAARSIGAALGLFGFARKCRVVLVTSSVNGEGKTVFCRALAESLAASGRHVLLVDGSPVRADGRELAQPAVSPDANHAKAGAVPFTNHAKVAAIPYANNLKAGAIPLPTRTAASETSKPRSLPQTVLKREITGSLDRNVFGSTEIERFVVEARAKFDIILLEGPAVLLVADSLVLGHLADTVIHLALWSKTKKATVTAALDRLYESSIAVDGVVLTRVNLKRHAALKTVDAGSYYLKEKRFYERLLGGRTMSPTKQTREV